MPYSLCIPGLDGCSAAYVEDVSLQFLLVLLMTDLLVPGLMVTLDKKCVRLNVLQRSPAGMGIVRLIGDHTQILCDGPSLNHAFVPCQMVTLDKEHVILNVLQWSPPVLSTDRLIAAHMQILCREPLMHQVVRWVVGQPWPPLSNLIWFRYIEDTWALPTFALIIHLAGCLLDNRVARLGPAAPEFFRGWVWWLAIYMAFPVLAISLFAMQSEKQDNELSRTIAFAIMHGAALQEGTWNLYILVGAHDSCV